jgi:hypothetical protein
MEQAYQKGLQLIVVGGCAGGMMWTDELPSVADWQNVSGVLNRSRSSLGGPWSSGRLRQCATIPRRDDVDGCDMVSLGF